MALLVSAAGYFFAEPLLKLLLAVPDEIAPHTTIYMKIIFCGMPFMFINFAMQGVLRGVGDSITPLKITALSLAMNVLLDPLMIFGFGPIPRLEVAGAALATVISRFFAALALIVLLFRGYRGLKIAPPNLIPDIKTFGTIFRIGLPVSLGDSSTALSFIFLQRYINHFGAAVISAFALAQRIISLSHMPAMGLGQATTVLSGQRIGGKRYAEAKKVAKQALLLDATVVTATVAAILIFRRPIIAAFINDPEVINTTSRLLLYIGPSVVVFSLTFIFQGAFQGGGNTRPILALAIIRLWGVRIPLAYLLAFILTLGYTGIAHAMLISNLAAALLYYIVWRRDRWLYHIADNKEQKTKR